MMSTGPAVKIEISGAKHANMTFGSMVRIDG